MHLSGNDQLEGLQLPSSLKLRNSGKTHFGMWDYSSISGTESRVTQSFVRKSSELDGFFRAESNIVKT
jgi:hypothetical protein